MTNTAWIALVGLALTVVGQAVLLIYAGTKFGTSIKVTMQQLIAAIDKLEQAVERLEKTVNHLDRRVSVLEDRQDREVV